MTARRDFNTAKVPRMTNIFPQAVVADQFIFISGTTGIDPVTGKIEYELHQSIDKHTKTLIASNIELFLNYCIRFYDRQFITRDTSQKGILQKFEALLNDYFTEPQTEGLPTVAWCAGELNLSANYFGDLIKKETGRSAQEYIQSKVIDIAKERVFDNNKSISEIAYELGFKYPQHFTRLFKQHVGYTPNEYRS